MCGIGGFFQQPGCLYRRTGKMAGDTGEHEPGTETERT